MSYIRYNHPRLYVKGTTSMYVFQSDIGIENMGGYTKEDMIEMLCRNWKTDDKLFKDWWIKIFASSIGVEMREKPLEAFSKEYNLEEYAISKKCEKWIKKVTKGMKESKKMLIMKEGKKVIYKDIKRSKCQL